MIYASSAEWLAAPARRLCLFGMSGAGKTTAAATLREAGWFHYSVDYRIGTRYMGEFIADNFKREAMKVALLRELLMSDSVYIASNITFDNLAPLSTYLGKPGDPAKGGIAFAEYLRRQAQHREAEIAALKDTAHFIARARDLYGYAHFVCDTGGSICEVVDPRDPQDAVLRALAGATLLVWIEGTDAHRAELIRRFDRAPKPIYYQPAFLMRLWSDYRAAHGLADAEVDPDAFLRHAYAQVLAHRQPRYAGMATWGVTVTMEEIAAARTEGALVDLVARALDRRGADA